MVRQHWAGEIQAVGRGVQSSTGSCQLSTGQAGHRGGAQGRAGASRAAGRVGAGRWVQAVGPDLSVGLRSVVQEMPPLLPPVLTALSLGPSAALSPRFAPFQGIAMAELCPKTTVLALEILKLRISRGIKP